MASAASVIPVYLTGEPAEKTIAHGGHFRTDDRSARRGGASFAYFDARKRIARRSGSRLFEQRETQQRSDWGRCFTLLHRRRIDGLRGKPWRNFSPSECEVALLFLKGLSSREIADLRGVVDKTIRAQATSIYQKSGLAGRTELSAFFLEDLLTPTRRSRKSRTS